MSANLHLIEAFQNGDREAFAQLVERYQNYISSLAYSATGDFAQSEDITQQAFLVAWQKHDQLREPSKWTAWLRAITRNIVRNHLRTRKNTTVSSPQVDEVVASNPPALERCITTEQSELLWSVLEAIPEHYREPLILFYREGQSVEKVAELLNLTPEATRQRLSRGRKRIKAEIAKFVEDSLHDSRPTPTLAGAILAAIPATTGKAVATPAAGVTASTLLTSKFWLILAGPLLGIAGAFLGCRASLKAAKSVEEKRLLWRMIFVICGEVILLLACQLIGSTWFRDVYFSIWVQLPVWTLHSAFLVAIILVYNRRLHEINERLGNQPDAVSPSPADSLISLAGLRWNMVGTLLGSTIVVSMGTIATGDWFLFIAWNLFLFTVIVYLWHDAARQKTLAAQIRYNAKSMMVVLFPFAALIMLRMDVWLVQFPRQPKIPGFLLAIGIVVFGLGLNAILQHRARNIEKAEGFENRDSSQREVS